MIAQLLISFLVDLVFESTATRIRSFDTEMTRYFEQKNFAPAPPEQALVR